MSKFSILNDSCQNLYPQEPKKLVRYRDNKIVSLKGERFTEVKREDIEEKKPVVAAKPQRKNNNH